MGFFERYLTVWEFLCIVVGVLIEVQVMLMVANFVNHARLVRNQARHPELRRMLPDHGHSSAGGLTGVQIRLTFELQSKGVSQ